MAKKVLLKDIVIHAGTVFDTAPHKTTRDNSHYDCVLVLSKNTSGTFTYCIDDDHIEELSEFFGDYKKGYKYKYNVIRSSFDVNVNLLSLVIINLEEIAKNTEDFLIKSAARGALENQRRAIAAITEAINNE